jgi:periplasmic protein TonB
MLIALALASLAASPAEPVLPRSIARACARRGLPRAPCTNLLPIFEQSRNYPHGALVRREQGVSYYHAEIGADGRVTACEITRTSGSRSLDQATCEILRDRVAYDPARDAEGRAIPGEDRGHVTWRLPGW